LEFDYFKTLYDKALLENLDIISSDLIIEQDGVIIISKPPFTKDIIFENDFIKNEILNKMMQDSGLNSCCTKLYRRNLLVENNITFPVGVALGEDGLFTFQCFFYAKIVLFLNYYGYHYREVVGSATRNSVSMDYFKRAMEAFHFDYTRLVPLTLDPTIVAKLKTLQLINNVLSYISIYLKPNKAVSFFARYRYVHSMISHPIVQKGIKKYEKELVTGKTRYQIFLLHCIKYKMTPLLVIAVTYSQIRNKN